MLDPGTQRGSRSLAYAPASTAAAATLTYLRERTFPQLIEPPQFAPRARVITAQPDWLTRQLRQLSRYVAFATAVAVIVLLVATAVPAWAAFRQSSPAAALPVQSSAGVTGNAAARVENLSTATFVGQIPFLEQARYMDAVSGATPAAVQFVNGARQSDVIAYLQEIGFQVTLPYLNNAAYTVRAIGWSTAVAEAKRKVALSRAGGASSGTAWQSTSLRPGTRITGATVTFYACLGNGFCGNMASGQQVFPGAAACSYDMPFGTRFIIASDPSQQVFVCLDRGALAPPWVDVWFYDIADGWAWQSIVGTRSDIIIVE